MWRFLTKAAPRSLTAWVLWGLIFGAAFGAAAPGLAVRLHVVADGFVSMMMLLIPPIIFTTVAGGMASLGSGRQMRHLSLKALIYYEAATAAALVIGLLVGNLLSLLPLREVPQEQAADQVASLRNQVEDFSTGLDTLLPESFFSAFTSGNPLHALCVGALIGGAMILGGERVVPVLDLINRCSHLLFCAVRLVLVCAPLAAFAGSAYTASRFGVMHLSGQLYLFLTFALTCTVVVLGGLGLLARLHGWSLLGLLRYLRHEILLVIGTSSSGPVFPRVLRKLELAGVPRATSAPLMAGGQSLHLIGTCIYLTLGAVYVSAVTGNPLSPTDQFLFVVLAMVMSKSAVGVTGSGLLTLVATVSFTHSFPLTAIALLIGIDRFMSEFRAITNLIGNAVATLVITRWAGQLDLDRLHLTLSARRPVEPDRPGEDTSVVEVRISDD
ncbi:cation:dicarboxylate symporter family transporter [Streptomyces swartbergensis]|uniref:C4-dicarboxylate transporter DctA n=1 Tax=Streptomyces swartbergensis TaxID=487165 RepID=A0A243S105_9ACTN|nr:cation:dicarboxylase symporter family transporter [Streptomyces swartbergensis]OUD00920.1 hypothetical protein CA983_22950 [Streptomyces swartbergensis]